MVKKVKKMKKMKKDISQAALKFWENGLAEKEKGHKEEAMKDFLAYYDMLTMFTQSFNTGISEELLRKRISEVETEIRELLTDEVYLKITQIPPEGIKELKSLFCSPKQENLKVLERYELLDAPVYVKKSMKGVLEVEQMTLVEYRNQLRPSERLLRMNIVCDGRSKEYEYDKLLNTQIQLKTIARRIVDSTGTDLNGIHTNPNNLLIQISNYPSIKNLLEDYLVRGGWITLEEALKIEVIGYPSTSMIL